MIRINLLPEEFHIRKKKIRVSPHWSLLVVGVAVFLLAILLLTVWQKSRIGRLEKEIQQTRLEADRQRADLALVEQLTALKEKILQRMQVVEQLNQNRTRWIEILTDLSQSMPEDMWIVSFKEEQGLGEPRVRIQGMTFSLQPIAFLMNNLKETRWFNRPQFTYAQRIPVPEGMAYDFEILSNLSRPTRVGLSPGTAVEQEPKKVTGKGKNDQARP